MSGFICCIIIWVIVIGVPITITILIGRSRVRNDFMNSVRSLHGLVIRESTGSIEVHLPGEAGTVAAAFFPRSGHWFGSRVLEMHFTIPNTQSQIFVCGNDHLVQSLPAGWSTWTDGTTQQLSWLVVATATPEFAEKFLEGGLLQAYLQLEKIHPHSCRVTINNDQLILLVSEFSNTTMELSNLLVFGNQLVRQIESIQSGQIVLTSPPALSHADAQCPICFSTVIQPVSCRVCGTPHCRDCWGYNDSRCGVFGCGGTPFEQ